MSDNEGYLFRIAVLEKERDFAREAVVNKCRQYDTDMRVMQTSLNREIRRIETLEAALREIAASSKRKGPPDFQYWWDVANDRRDIARAALAPEQDK